MLFENKIYREKKQRKKSFSIIITFFVIFLLIISVLFYNSRKDIKIEINNNRETRFIGTIHIDDHFPSYTHRATNENQSIAIKSSSFNLNNFINQNIELIGHTEYSISKKEDIMDVIRLKDLENRISIYSNKYLLSEDLLLFDFSEDSELNISKTGDKIYIYFNNTELFNIEPFICNKVSELQDCDKIKENLENQELNIFESKNKDIYYNISKDKRITFNESNLGYYIRVNKIDNLLNLSHIIHIIDSDYIKENQNTSIKDACSKDGIKKSSILKLESSIATNGILRIQSKVKPENNDNTYTCNIFMDIFNSRNIDSVSITES